MGPNSPWVHLLQKLFEGHLFHNIYAFYKLLSKKYFDSSWQLKKHIIPEEEILNRQPHRAACKWELSLSQWFAIKCLPAH